MTPFVILFFLAAVAAALAILALLFVLRRRSARVRALEAENRALADQMERLGLLERREQVCRPLDALWLCWARCAPPDDATLDAASAAAEAATRLFPADLAPDLDDFACQLAALVRHRACQHDAVLAGRHGERVALMEEEAEMVRVLRSRLGALRTLIADAARPVA